MTTRNKKKLAALNKENCEEHPRSNLAQNSSAPRSQEVYITQVSEEIEGRVTKRLSKEFSRTENRILGALARLDNFLMNPLLPGRSGTTPKPSRNALNTSQGTNEEDSQNDPHPEADVTQGHDITLFLKLSVVSCPLEGTLKFLKIHELFVRPSFYKAHAVLLFGITFVVSLPFERYSFILKYMPLCDFPSTYHGMNKCHAPAYSFSELPLPCRGAPLGQR